MHTYKLPEVREDENELKEVATGVDSSDAFPIGVPSSWEREIRFPVDDVILAALTLGDKVTVTLTGDVIEASKNESRHNSSRAMSISMESVSVESANKKADDDFFNSGFDMGPKRGY